MPGAVPVAGLFAAAVVLTILTTFGGWEYYRAPIGTRGYLPSHAWLRPSGDVGLALGFAGVAAMLGTLPYAVRKRWRLLARVGTTAGWLEVHIFFGIVGPLLITLHTSFKFNGLISAGYWLMMTVWASGFVGRYLYVRIPRSIHGAELTREELQAQLDAVRLRVAEAPLPAAARQALGEFETAMSPRTGRAPGALDLFLGELRVRVRIGMLRRHLRSAGVDLALLHDAVALAAERAAVARRLEHLRRTRKLFDLWHVFHQPLVLALFAIVALHVGIAVYLGYVRFSWQAP